MKCREITESGRGTRPSELLAIRPFGREISRRGPIAALKTENFGYIRGILGNFEILPRAPTMSAKSPTVSANAPTMSAKKSSTFENFEKFNFEKFENF